MARRKGPSLDVPVTTEEALALIDAYVTEDHDGQRDMLDVAGQIAQAKAALASRHAAREERQKARFASLKAWWEAAGAARFAGRKRSAVLGGAKLGTRLTPPALKLPKGRTAAEIVDALLEALAGDFIRTTHALDKEAIITALRQPPGEDAAREAIFDHRVLAEELGLTVVQADEFFIDTGGLVAETTRQQTAAG